MPAHRCRVWETILGLSLEAVVNALGIPLSTSDEGRVRQCQKLYEYFRPQLEGQPDVEPSAVATESSAPVPLVSVEKLSFCYRRGRFEFSPRLQESQMRPVISRLRFQSIPALMEAAPDLAARLDQAWTTFSQIFTLLLVEGAFSGDKTIGEVLPGGLLSIPRETIVSPNLFSNLLGSWMVEVTAHTSQTQGAGGSIPYMDMSKALFPRKRIMTPSMHVLLGE
jgi:hypothetical protein